MARLIKNRRCVVCGKNNVYLWTLDNMQKVAVTYLCKEDSAPLLAVMELAGDQLPDDQLPVPDRGSVPELDIHQRGRRQQAMAPLLDWTPPTPPPLHTPPPEPVVEEEEPA